MQHIADLVVAGVSAAAVLVLGQLLFEFDKARAHRALHARELVTRRRL